MFPVVCIIIEEIMKTLSKDTFLHSQFNLRYGVAAKWDAVIGKIDFLTAKRYSKALVYSGIQLFVEGEEDSRTIPFFRQSKI